jgi:uncharacterized membrane protein (UPF0127 family)
MKIFIHQTLLKLIIFLTFLATVTSCNSSSSSHLDSYSKRHLQLPSGEKFKVYIAKTDSQQREGLSKIRNKDFSANEGMFFTGETMFARQFWMPETHFNLDLFFLNAELYVLDIHRNLQHSPSTSKDRSIVPLSREVISQHVLELKSSSKLAKKIKRGMILKWNVQNP